MKKAVLIVALALAAVVAGTLIYAKFFVTPLDKEGMVYTPPEEAGEEEEQDADEKPPPAPAQTAEAQIGLFLAQKALWYQGGPEYAPACLYYAVTDLNQNGRLELIRSEFRYDTTASINRESRVTTELLGEKWLNRSTGEASYLRGTEEIAHRDYDGADFFRYGDDCCECAWEWVELLEGWSEAEQRQALMDSWEHFVFDTLGILTR